MLTLAVQINIQVFVCLFLYLCKSLKTLPFGSRILEQLPKMTGEYLSLCVVQHVTTLVSYPAGQVCMVQAALLRKL